MTDPFIDTDVLIRLLTGDDPEKQARAAELFEQIEKKKIRVVAPVTVIADAVYVLSSKKLYNLPRSEIVGVLTPLLRLPNFRVRHRRIVRKALDIYLCSNLDFGDAFLAASMQQAKSETVYSYDADFDHIQGIHRLEP